MSGPQPQQIAAVAVEQIDKVGGAGGASPAVEEIPSAVDIQRFESALNIEQGPGQVSSTEALNYQAEALGEIAESELTLGDRILEGVGNLNKNMTQTVQRASDAFTATDDGGMDLNVGELLMTQLDLAVMGVTYDVTAKASGKVGEGVNTIIRSQ